MTNKKENKTDLPKNEQSDMSDEERKELAAQAGGYNLSEVGATPVSEDEAEEVDTGAAFTGGDAIEDQEGREEAGPFTGTGNQDAHRTEGRVGASDAHHADERTSGDESAVEDDEDDKDDNKKSTSKSSAKKGS